MGRKAKYSTEQKIQACEDYLSGKKSAKQIAMELGMGNGGAHKIRLWARICRVNGSEIFQDKLFKFQKVLLRIDIFRRVENHSTIYEHLLAPTVFIKIRL